MKKLAALLWVAAFALTGCANFSMNDVYQPPTFAYENTQFERIDWTSLSGRSLVSINNSNRYSLPVNQLGIEVWLEGEPWLNFNNTAINGLAAQQSTPLDVSWTMVFDELAQRASGAYQAGEAKLSIRLAPTLQVPLLGAQTMNWQQEFTVPVPKLPTMNVTAWRLESISFTQLTMGLDLAINNPNKFALNARNLNVDIQNNGRSLIQSGLAPLSLAADGEGNAKTSVTLSFADLGLTLVSALRTGSWPQNLAVNWKGAFASPDLGIDLPMVERSARLAFN